MKSAFDLINVLFNNGEYNKTINILENVVGESYIHVNYYLAESYRRLGMHDNALKY